MPVNVCVGACLLKELRHCSYEDLIMDLVFDPRLQYALHITPDPDSAPLCTKTLQRCRVANAAYTTETGIDLFGDTIKELGGAIADAMNIDRRYERIDSSLISANIRDLSRFELIFECNKHLVKSVNKEDGAFLPEELKWYLEDSAHNNTFYHNKVKDYKTRLLTDATKLLEICKEKYSELKDYKLLARCIEEQTISEDGGVRLATSEDNKLNGNMMQAHSDPEATCTQKYGINKGYSGMVVEAVGENGSVVVDFSLQTNTYGDPQFGKDAVEQMEPQDEKATLLGDGAFCGEGLKELAAEKNVEIVTTNLTGKVPDDFYADFELNEEETAVLKCPAGKTPIASTREGDTIKSTFASCDCANCPFKDNCNPRFLKTQDVAKKDIKPKTVHRARVIRFMSTDEFKAFARMRNGVETVFSILKRYYGFSNVPRGLLPMRWAFAAKVGAYNFRKLFRYRRGLGNYASNPLLTGTSGANVG